MKKITLFYILLLFNLVLLHGSNPRKDIAALFKKGQLMVQDGVLSCKSLKLISLYGLPAAPWKMVTVLDLSGNKLRELLGGMFVAMPSLRVLNVSNNNIQKIHEDAFRGLEKLKVLSLVSNLIKSLPSDLELTTPCLEKLLLSFNFLYEFKNVGHSNVKHLVLDSVAEEAFNTGDKSLQERFPQLLKLCMCTNSCADIKSGFFSGYVENHLVLVVDDLMYQKLSKLCNSDGSIKSFFEKEADIAFDGAITWKLTLTNPSDFYLPKRVEDA
jgi:hypothetical protein